MLIKKAAIPTCTVFYSPCVLINKYTIKQASNSCLLGKLSVRQRELIGVKITSIKIQEIKKNDIQEIDIHKIKNHYSNWTDDIRKYTVLTINNKYKIIWATFSKDTTLILPEELQQYLKQ
jgi:hypothetical protein